MYRVALLLPVLQLLLLQPASVAPALAAHELSFLVLSQPARFNAARAHHLKRSIVEQIRELNQEITPKRPTDSVFLTHELFPEQDGAWAITPILGHIRAAMLKSTHRTARWLIVCEEQSHVNVSLLAHHLANEDYREKLFLGYPLYDREATIIHHFAFFKNPTSFLYPYLRAGIALTVPLVDHLVQLLSDTGTPRPPLSDFFIDAAHEFALLVWQRGEGVPLQPRRYLCAKALPSCAIHGAASQDHGTSGTGRDLPDRHDDSTGCTDDPTEVDQIMFAVKTCSKYHKDRVPALKQTWTRYVQHLRYFSDVDDPTIPTIATSVPNSSAGHCAKTLEILQLIGDELRYNGSLQAIRWVMLVDDDTILSTSALARFLSCYDPGRDLYLGERYGYRLLGADGGGYNYVTGGGGIVLSVAILDALQRTCECPSASSPDDMILAACLQRLGIRPIHSPLFHQARPSDYAPELLDRRGTVSFHKHWQIDPQQVYNRWFRQQDEHYFARQSCPPDGGTICKHSTELVRTADLLRPAALGSITAGSANGSVREHARIGPSNEDEHRRPQLSQCKLKTQTCFKNLQKLERKSYLPSVEEPLSVLEGSNAQSVQLRPDGTLSERIVPQAGGIVVVNLSGDDFASHDALIDALYARLHKEHPNIVAIYTGKTPSFSYSSLVRKTRQAGQEPEPAKVELKTDGFLMVYEKFMFGQADAAELTVAQLGEATKVENATTDVVQIRLTGAGAQVDLFFLLTQGSWEITGVWFDNQEYYLRHRVHVNQHFSYSCNQWEYYSYDLQKKIVFEEVQLQPFWPGADGVAPPNNRFGDAWYCVGFTTGGILSGLFLVLIFIIIGSYGIAWMMDIRTMDRFDDPKGKTITVNAAE